VAVYRQGDPVVDAVAGVAAAAVHVLAERGVLVGTWHQDRLPRPDVRLHCWRDRSSGHRQPISRVLREEVSRPLGVVDELFFGVPESELGGLARLEEAEGNQGMFAAIPEDSPMFELGPPECTTAAYGSRADALAADVPAYGTATARAVARMYAALLGEVDGVWLISPERSREVSTVAMSGVDQVFGFPTSWGLGYSKKDGKERRGPQYEHSKGRSPVGPRPNNRLFYFRRGS
jgi:Beta-lactamase